jgi:hypothetical protein
LLIRIFEASAEVPPVEVACIWAKSALASDAKAIAETAFQFIPTCKALMSDVELKIKVGVALIDVFG